MLLVIKAQMEIKTLKKKFPNKACSSCNAAQKPKYHSIIMLNVHKQFQ